jgi:hypothetical protein
MRFIHYLAAAAPLLLQTLAHQEKIPYLDAVVKAELREFGHSETVEGTNITARDLEGAIDERATTPYWLEVIAHQGKAAFGQANYKVFRNVKDYGAKGMSTIPMLCG